MSVFFTSRKIAFKSWLDTSSIASYMSSFLGFFSYRNLACTSIPGGSIKIRFVCLIASRHLVDRSSFRSWFWWVDPRYLLDTSAVDKHFLDTSSTDCSIPLDTCICRDLLASLYKAFARSGSHFIQYLSVALPKTLSSHSNLVPQGFLKFFQVSLYLVGF